MRPLHLIPIFFLASIVAGILVYVSYPLEVEESYGIINTAFADEMGVRSVEGAPGFVAGAASVSVDFRNVTIEGVVSGHGFAKFRDVRVPFMKVDTGDREYIVVMSKRVASQIAGGRADIIEFPGMMGHRVVVNGLQVDDTRVIVARSVYVEMHMPGPMHRGPMNPWWQDR
ncbi:MAG: hypothetical protein F7B18_05625 [Desulfurococcales archaeon]|nr:hypothetical protein [Desulfurococcales archaeon]